MRRQSWPTILVMSPWALCKIFSSVGSMLFLEKKSVAVGSILNFLKAYNIIRELD